MNVNTIKAVCWSTSVAATLYMSYFVWDFYQRWDQNQRTYDPVFVQAVLDENYDVTAQVAQRIDYADIQRAYVRMNWTGKKAPAPVPIAQEAPQGPAKPVYTPVASLLSILMIQVDMADAADSRVVVRYKGGGITLRQGTLSVGETLPSPHQGVKVEKIEVTGVEFSFDGVERENETLSPSAGAWGSEALIVRVGPEGERYPVRPFSIPQGATRELFSPKETTLVGHNRYRIGTDDARYLGENFAEVLTNDVRTKVHYDEKTGQRAGIQLLDVRAGSAAERHGAQAGDIIKSINGHPVTSKQEAIKFVKNNQDRYKIWEVVVENLGRERTVVYESPSD